LSQRFVLYISDNVDVNVTPDKRQVFLEGEKHILATVKVYNGHALYM